MILSFINKNKYLIVFSLIFLASIIFRVIPIFYQGIWLDEQYSLFFAQNFTWQDLLITFQSDTHPGLFYLFLKVLLVFSKDLIQLRILGSLLPQLLGMSIIFYLVEKVSTSKNKLPLLASALILGFNPLLVMSSWQLRSYNLVVLLIPIVLASVVWFLRKKTVFRLAVVVLASMLANLPYYGVFIFTFSALIFCIFQTNFNRKKKLFYFFVFSLVYILQFFLMSGVQIKSQFEKASWLPAPTIKNIPSVFFTVAGVKSNYFLPSNSPPFEILIFYLLVMVIIYKIIDFIKNIDRYKKSLSLNNYSEWYFLVLLPIFLVITLSFLLRFLSNRIIFHEFIPRISLLVPRIFIPSVIFISFYFSLWIGKARLNYKHLLIIFVLGIIWLQNSFYLKLSSAVYINSELNTEVAEIIERSSHKDVIIYPSWFWIFGTNLKENDVRIKKLIDYSDKFIDDKSEEFSKPKEIYVFQAKIKSDGMHLDKKMFSDYLKNSDCSSESISNPGATYLLYSCS